MGPKFDLYGIADRDMGAAPASAGFDLATKPQAAEVTLAPHAVAPQFATWRPARRVVPVNNLSSRDIVQVLLITGAAIVGAMLLVQYVSVDVANLGTLPLYVFILMKSLRCKPTPPVDVDLDEPSALPQFRVSLALSWRGAVYGRDVGHVSFVDGWMVYAGARTDFAVHSDDAIRLNGQWNESRFRWVADSFKGEISVYPSALGAQPDKNGTALRKEMREWLQLKDKRLGVSPFPPCVPAIGKRADMERCRRRSQIALCVTAAFIVGLGSIAVMRRVPIPFWGGLVLVFIVGAIAYGIYGDADAQLKVLRQMGTQ